ncbi:exonuclease [Microbacterium phage RubyRalph]|nr:exonuclease [Microbacterium phage RubyRalph]
MAENIQAEILRDTELEQRLLEAVIADRNDQPRSKQLQVGPSEVGGCRELLRAGLFEPPAEAIPETAWAAAAHVGTVMGADLERIFGERLDALTQQRITTTFGMLGGLQIAGSIDLLFVDGNQISDLKSNDDIGGLLVDLKRDASAIETLLSIRREGLLYQKNIETPDGGYELTSVIVDKISKLHYYVQVAIYVVGAMQAGILDPEQGEGRIVYYDRAGRYQGFIAVRMTPEMVALFYEIGQMRIAQVLQAQQAYEATGQVAVIATLRDKTPSYCFSPKVMCPRRDYCWTGSEWMNANQVSDPEQISLKNRYKLGRDLAKLADNMKRTARDELKEHEVAGQFPDGEMLTWTKSGAINLVETTVTEPQPQAVLDQFLPPVDLQAEIDRDRARPPQPIAAVVDPDEQQIIREQEAISEAVTPISERLTREQRFKALQNTKAPEVRRMANSLTGIELKGLRKEDAIDAILRHEYPTAAVSQPQPDSDSPDRDAVRPEEEYETLAEEAAQGGPAGDEAADMLDDARRAEWTDEGDLTAQSGPEFADPPERDPRIDRVQFEPSEPEVTPEQEEARQRLMRGPHVAPLLDKPAPTPAPNVITLPDGSPYVPLENEDPKRPGLFLDVSGKNSSIRQMQYDSDPTWREQLLRQRSMYEGRIPAAQNTTEGNS